MQVADKNVPEPVGFNPVFKNLHLRTFAAVDQKILIIHLQYLCGVMTAVKGSTRAVAEYCEVHLVRLIF